MSLRIEKSLDLGKLSENVRAVLPSALRTAMEHVKEVAVELTPIEEGTLRRSAKAGVEEVDGALAGFVHYDGPYARYQHEKLNLRHPNGGQAKFLETALTTETDRAIEIVTEQISKAL